MRQKGKNMQEDEKYQKRKAWAIRGGGLPMRRLTLQEAQEEKKEREEKFPNEKIIIWDAVAAETARMCHNW